MPHLPQPLRQLRPLLLAGALVWLAGCDMATGVATQGLIHSYSKPALEPRDGYVVDHRHPARGHNSRVHFLILHYTDENQADSLRALTGPRVSSHYLLPLPTRRLQGSPVVFQLVPESRRACTLAPAVGATASASTIPPSASRLSIRAPTSPGSAASWSPPRGSAGCPTPTARLKR